ncbi:MAG: DUF3015 family protein [Bdellovibrionales bacterium]|jgi:hypothetical protein|nr:DUF3015 family protein [Bdellovibrionales bacterium]
MRHFARIAVAASIGFFAQGAMAQDSGCGLGSMIINENTKVMQLLAATTNGFMGTQTFGISTGTSNCKAQNLVMQDKAVQYFAEVNKDDLSREMAKGEGEKLSTLAALYGCDTTEARAEFGKAAQAAYGRILPTAETSVANMVQNLNNESSVVGTCSAI